MKKKLNPPTTIAKMAIVDKLSPISARDRTLILSTLQKYKQIPQ